MLPGHNNCNPLTKEGIQHKEMESRRLQLLQQEDKQIKVGYPWLPGAHYSNSPTESRLPVRCPVTVLYVRLCYQSFPGMEMMD